MMFLAVAEVKFVEQWLQLVKIEIMNSGFGGAAFLG